MWSSAFHCSGFMHSAWTKLPTTVFAEHRERGSSRCHGIAMKPPTMNKWQICEFFHR